MPQLSLGFQALCISSSNEVVLSRWAELVRRKTSQRTPRMQSDDYWEGWLHCTFKVNALQL